MLPGMETFDSIAVLALLGLLLCVLFRPARWAKGIASLLAVAGLSTLIHLVGEGARWQMVPAYLLLALLLLMAAIAWRRRDEQRPRRTWLRIVASLCGVLLLAVTVLACYVFPMFRLPAPAGPFAVGTDEFHLIDQHRLETDTGNPFDHRELMVRVWYPADAIATAQDPEPYWRHAGRAAAAINKQHWPVGYLVSHLQLVPTHAYWAAPLSKRQPSYPVLIFSHGLSEGVAVQNTVLMEELASRGYVVFSIDHTYGGMAAVFPDGRVALFDREAYLTRKPERAGDDLVELIDAARHNRDAQALTRLLDRMAREQPQGTALFRYWQNVWSQDQRFVMDTVARLQSGERPSRFAGHLQPDRIGVMGMSFGGSSSTTTCSADPRCKAGINLDGTIGTALETPPQQVPFMYFSNGQSGLNRVSYARDVGYRYLVEIAGSGHLDHSDAPYLTSLFSMLGDGDRSVIGAKRVVSVVNAYVRAFFDQHLLGQPQPLLAEPSADYPEVTFTHDAPRQLPEPP